MFIIPMILLADVLSFLKTQATLKGIFYLEYAPYSKVTVYDLRTAL